MTIRCSQGHENPDGSMFCDECGERLDQQVAAAQSYPQAAPMSPMSSSPSMPSAPSMPSMPPVTPMPSQPAPVATMIAPKLIVESDNATFDLGGKSEWVIGREDPVSNIFPDIDLTPHGGEDGGVSRLHAKLFAQGGQFLVEDQNSTNFTFVNRQKLAPKTPTPIKDGDELKLGRVVMKFTTA